MKEKYTESEKGGYFYKDRKRSICALELEYVNSIFPARGRFLDVGCGNGTFAELAFEDGWESYGLDPSAKEKVRNTGDR